MNRKGRRLPAEWEPQQGIILGFPHNGKDWPGKYGAICWALVEFIRKIAVHEKVYLLVCDTRLEERVADMLHKASVPLDRIHFIIHKTNRSWLRDSGPVIVHTEQGREALNFNFNGWAKYRNFRLDREVPGIVAATLDIPLVQVRHKGRPVVLEGGAIDGNGQGSLLTSEECLLHPDIQVRNRHFDRGAYEAVFAEYLGVSHVIWMGDGIEGDDTHGHIDDLCRFVNASTVVSVVESDAKHPNYGPLQDNLERLDQSRLENGRTPEIITLPMPETLVFDGVRLPASYANFLILNETVLVPTFNDEKDRDALEILASCFPDRTVTGVSAIDLIWGFGTLHCLSQQVPSPGKA